MDIKGSNLRNSTAIGSKLRQKYSIRIFARLHGRLRLGCSDEQGILQANPTSFALVSAPNESKVRAAEAEAAVTSFHQENNGDFCVEACCRSHESSWSFLYAIRNLVAIPVLRASRPSCLPPPSPLTGIGFRLLTDMIITSISR